MKTLTITTAEQYQVALRRISQLMDQLEASVEELDIMQATTLDLELLELADAVERYEAKVIRSMW